jgi:hypothetical protein
MEVWVRGKISFCAFERSTSNCLGLLGLSSSKGVVLWKDYGVLGNTHSFGLANLDLDCFKESASQVLVKVWKISKILQQHTQKDHMFKRRACHKVSSSIIQLKKLISFCERDKWNHVLDKIFTLTKNMQLGVQITNPIEVYNICGLSYAQLELATWVVEGPLQPPQPS